MALDAFEIKHGIVLAYQGFREALSRPKILRYFYKSFIFVVCTMSIFYIVVNSLIYSPLYIIRIGNRIGSYFFQYDATRFDQLVEETIYYLGAHIKAIPLTCLYLIRYIYPYPMNNIFLVSVKTLSSPHYYSLVQKPYHVDYWGELKDSASRIGTRFKKMCLVFALSKVPIVGVFVIPLASLYLTSQAIGVKLSLAVAALPLAFPGTKFYLAWCLHTIYSTRALSRELLEPYFGRVGMNSKARAKFFKGKNSVLLGFSIGYYLLISSVPVIGPVFYVFAQSAIATFLVKTISSHDLTPITPSDPKPPVDSLKEPSLDIPPPYEEVSSRPLTDKKFS